VHLADVSLGLPSYRRARAAGVKTPDSRNIFVFVIAFFVAVSPVFAFFAIFGADLFFALMGVTSNKSSNPIPSEPSCAPAPAADAVVDDDDNDGTDDDDDDDDDAFRFSPPVFDRLSPAGFVTLLVLAIESLLSLALPW
jgi:hypothetical protein